MNFLLKCAPISGLLMILAVILAFTGVAEPIVWICFALGVIPWLLIAMGAWVGL
jgi:hypothetical protein